MRKTMPSICKYWLESQSNSWANDEKPLKRPLIGHFSVYARHVLRALWRGRPCYHCVDSNWELILLILNNRLLSRTDKMRWLNSWSSFCTNYAVSLRQPWHAIVSSFGVLSWLELRNSGKKKESPFFLMPVELLVTSGNKRLGSLDLTKPVVVNLSEHLHDVSLHHASSLTFTD